MTINVRFKIGDQFYHVKGKTKIVATIIDIYRTYNVDHNLVKVRYVATHPFGAQVLTDYDVVDTTIARNFINTLQTSNDPQTQARGIVRTIRSTKDAGTP